MSGFDLDGSFNWGFEEEDDSEISEPVSVTNTDPEKPLRQSRPRYQAPAGFEKIKPIKRSSSDSVPRYRSDDDNNNTIPLLEVAVRTSVTATTADPTPASPNAPIEVFERPTLHNMVPIKRFSEGLDPCLLSDDSFLLSDEELGVEYTEEREGFEYVERSEDGEDGKPCDFDFVDIPDIDGNLF